MPVRLDTIRNFTRRITIPLEGLDNQELAIRYKQWYITPEYMAKLNEARKDREASEAAIEANAVAVHELVTEWDLLDNEDNVVPLELDYIRQLPVEITELILTKMTEDRSPKGTKNEP